MYCVYCVCVYSVHYTQTIEVQWALAYRPNYCTNIINYCNSYAHNIIVKTVRLCRKIKFTLLLTYFTLLFLTDSRVGRFWVLRKVMLLEVPLGAKWITNIKNYFDPKTNKSYPFKGPSSKIPEGKILKVKKNIFKT